MPLNQNDAPVLNFTTWASARFKNDQNIYLHFSEDVIAGDGDIILSNGTDKRVIPIDDISQVTFSSKSGESDSNTHYGSLITIDPSTDLVPGTDYSLQIASGVIRDLAGNDYTGFNETSAIQSSGPTLLSNIYREGPMLWDGTLFKIDDSVKLHFDEPATAGSGKIIISNGSDTRTIDVSDTSQVTFGYDEWGVCVATINPTLDLTLNTNYSVQIANGVITDLAGNPFTGTGIDEESSIKFTVQNSNPLMMWSNPWSSSFFKIDDDITFYFDEAVVPGNGSITISNGSDTRIVDIHDATQVSYTDETHLAGKINLADDLIPNSNYSIQITEGAILDNAGNPYLDIGVNAPINFTTIPSNPKLTWNNFIWSDPALAEEWYSLNHVEGQTDDPFSIFPLEKFKTDNDLLLGFDEPVIAGHGKIVISNTDGTDVRRIAVDDANQVAFDEFGCIITINPLSDLLPDNTYHIKMNSGVIVDKSGNPYEGVQDDITLDFVTGVEVTGYFNNMMFE